jgi:hypothetical protein
MAAINPNRAGLSFGVVLGGWHLLWAALVATGFAQPVLDFIFWMHFIKPVYVVGPFQPAVAVLLVGTTALVGYVMGAAFGLVWNRVAGVPERRVRP